MQILIRKEVKIMKYNKPEVAMVGSALESVKQANKPNSGLNDNSIPRPNSVTVTAYEADE